MKVKVLLTLTDFEDQPLVDGVNYVCARCGHAESSGKDLTLRSALIQALTRVKQGEEVKGEEQLKRFDLALRINANDVVDLSTKEAAKCQELVAKSFSPIVTGQVWKILDGLDPKSLDDAEDDGADEQPKE